MSVGDALEVYFPLSLRFEHIDDQRPQFAGVGAILFGPLMLAGFTHDDYLPLGEAVANLSAVIRRNSSEGQPLSFEAKTGGTGCETTVHLISFNDVTNGHAETPYAVYFHTSGERGATTPAGTAELSIATATGETLAGWNKKGPITIADVPTKGSDTVARPHINTNHHGHQTHLALEDPLHRHMLGYDELSGSHYARRVPAGTIFALRSGGQQTSSSLELAAPLNGTQRLTSVTFAYRYLVGYDKKVSGGAGAKLSLLFRPNIECPGDSTNATVLYSSGPLLLPSFDKCHTGECYSKPVNVSVAGLNLSVAESARLALEFSNGDHNLQLLLPIHLKLGWVS
eukprot:COSAG01_NODE_1153_length_11487_cov_98.298736_9_plen_341_part_00